MRRSLERATMQMYPIRKSVKKGRSKKVVIYKI